MGCEHLYAMQGTVNDIGLLHWVGICVKCGDRLEGTEADSDAITNDEEGDYGLDT